MAQPLRVSVVMCTYNGAAFLAGQLQSILQQTHPIDEIVVVDDCSTDGTTEIISSFAVQHPIIKLHRNTSNLGYNVNFEKALSLAQGDVLAIADQDDIWHPQKIEILLAHWPAESPLIYSDSVLFSGAVPQNPKPGRWMNRLSGKDPRKLALFNTVSGHAMMLRRSLLQLALPFNPGVYYDWWLAVVAACNGGITYHPQVLVYQRTHNNNTSLPIIENEREKWRREKAQINNVLQQLGQAPNMRPEDQAFFKTLYQLWNQPAKDGSRWSLFLFLMRHRKKIYSSKKRLFPLITHIKRSLRYAFKKV